LQGEVSEILGDLGNRGEVKPSLPGVSGISSALTGLTEGSGPASPSEGPGTSHEPPENTLLDPLTDSGFPVVFFLIAALWMLFIGVAFWYIGPLTRRRTNTR